jgi:hypothetical protein
LFLNTIKSLHQKITKKNEQNHKKGHKNYNHI